MMTRRVTWIGLAFLAIAVIRLLYGNGILG
jgi:hypothetical protein